jgi:hypothetical protein
MNRQDRNGFIHGLFTGAAMSLVLGFIVLYLLTVFGQVSLTENQWPTLIKVFDWMLDNLGLSIVPFALTLGFFLDGMGRLIHCLDGKQPPEQVAQLESLTDVWISLFFGIGVIWTAVGMRGALLHALGTPGQIDGGQAITVLERLVDGGILTALSTTILGGAGGYLMRLVKTLLIGARLNRYYETKEQVQTDRVEFLLNEIRHSLRTAPMRRSDTPGLPSDQG